MKRYGLSFLLLVSCLSFAGADEFTVSTVLSNPSSVFDNLVVTGTSEIGFSENAQVQIGALDYNGKPLYQEQTVRTAKTMRFATADNNESTISVVAKDGTYVTGGIFGSQNGISVYSGGDVFINTGDQTDVPVKIWADYLYAYQAVFLRDFAVESIKTTELSFVNSAGDTTLLRAPYDYLTAGAIYWHAPKNVSAVTTTDVYTGWHASNDAVVIASAKSSSYSLYRSSIAGEYPSSISYSISRLRVEPVCKKASTSNIETACRAFYDISSEDGFLSSETPSTNKYDAATLSSCALGSSQTLEDFASKNCTTNSNFKCYLQKEGELTVPVCQSSTRTDSGLFCLYADPKPTPVMFTVFSCDGVVTTHTYSAKEYIRDRFASRNVQTETPVANRYLRLITFSLDGTGS